MGESWTGILVAVMATIFFAVYGFTMLVFPNRLRDRRAGSHPLRTQIGLRVFGALMLLLSVVVIWVAAEAVHH
jgi:hypothetical protein